MNAGKLNERVALQAQVLTQDTGSGVVSSPWQTVKTVWGQIDHLSAREMMAAANTSAQYVARIKIRYTPGVVPSMRAVVNGVAYDIHGVLPDNRSGKEYLTLPVSRVVSG